MKTIVWASVVAAILSVISVITVLTYAVVSGSFTPEIPLVLGMSSIAFAVLAIRE